MRLFLYLLGLLTLCLGCQRIKDYRENHAENITQSFASLAKQAESVSALAKSGDEFACSDETLFLVRFDPESQSLQYCHEQGWVDLPLALMVERLPILQNLAKFQKSQEEKEGKERRGVDKTRSSFYCRPNPAAADSYMCMRKPK